MTSIPQIDKTIHSRSENLCHEIELKYRMSSKKDFEKFKKIVSNVSVSKKPEVLQQTNYFFDTKEFALRKESLAVRIRKENSRFKLSIKGDNPLHLRGSKALSVRLEYEKDMAEETASHALLHKTSGCDFLWGIEETDQVKSSTIKYLLREIKQTLKGDDLRLIGGFENVRYCYEVQIDGQKRVLEIDETQFPKNKIHFEVEVEIPDRAYEAVTKTYLIDLFKSADITFTHSSGKAERFFRFLATS
jgi:uncharacterized protein YjbK